MKILQNKLKGNSLYLAIIISFIASIMLFLFILWRYYNVVEITHAKSYQQLTDNAASALNVIMQDPEIVGLDQEQNIDLYNDSTGMVTIGKRQWGLYGVAYARTEWRKYKVQRIAMFGAKTVEKESIGLYLADRGHYLAVAGDTYISGINYLPKLGIRKAYIDGKSFKYNKTVDGTIRESKDKLPPLPDYLITYLKNKLFGQEGITDSVVMENTVNEKEINNSYLQKTLRIYNTEGIRLSGIKLSGNCIIHSESFIQVAKSAELENIICVAPLIYVDRSFEGTVQLFATDTIEIAENVKLLYPSSVVVAGIDRSSAYVHIAKESVVEGTVLAFAEMQGNNTVSIALDEESEIYGTVYCDGRIQHKGKVFGTVYCTVFYLQTRQGYYENHILGGWIDPLGLDQEFITGNIIPSTIDTHVNDIVQWLD